MQQRLTALVVGLILVLAGVVVSRVIFKPRQTRTPVSVPQETTRAMKLTSLAFSDGEVIPTRYTCNGVNLSPPLSITGVPAGVKTLALVVDDPDAPLGTFNHWLVWNISPQTTTLAEGSVPEGSQPGTNSAGKTNYFGPCPPAKHRYFFKLYALDSPIGLDGKAKSGDLATAMQGHIIAEAHLMGVYGGR